MPGRKKRWHEVRAKENGYFKERIDPAAEFLAEAADSRRQQEKANPKFNFAVYINTKGYFAAIKLKDDEVDLDTGEIDNHKIAQRIANLINKPFDNPTIAADQIRFVVMRQFSSSGKAISAVRNQGEGLRQNL